MSQIETLNRANHLTAHLVSPSTDPALIQASLDLTRVLFPYEPTAPQTLGHAYDVLTSGQSRYGDCDLLDYFIYTLGPTPQHPVVGASGLYRLIERTDAAASILDNLRNRPPASVEFLRNQKHDISDFIWGGRFCIEPLSARSPSSMPFISHHILSIAQRTMSVENLPPALLAFTMRDDNDRVKRFYTQTGFEPTGASLHYGGRIQDVFVLNLSPTSRILERLAGLKAAAAKGIVSTEQ